METTTKVTAQINDMRGAAYSANTITIHNNLPHYAGMKINELLLTDNPRSAHEYSIRSHGTQLGTICLTNEDAQKVKKMLIKEIDFTRINNDTNGNPRYVCHFFNLINKGDEIKANANPRDPFSIDTQYNLALIKANKIGGRKFHNKQYGGGIVFQSYNIQDTAEAINEAKEVNTNFITSWTSKDFKKAEKAIVNHFRLYSYDLITEHGKPARKMTIQENYNFESLDALLGLAYTSSGYCAEYGICNGVYVMANKTHHFDSFMINELGEVVASVQDNEEKSIYITL